MSSCSARLDPAMTWPPGRTSTDLAISAPVCLKLVIDMEKVADVVDRASQLCMSFDMAYKRTMVRITKIREEQQEVEPHPK